MSFATDSTRSKSLSEHEIATLADYDIQVSMSDSELIDVIRAVDYPQVDQGRLEFLDRKTLERIVCRIRRRCSRLNGPHWQ